MQRNTIFLAYFFICVNCFSQQYPFVYYTPKDGLVNSRVRSIKQDTKGRMLFTTFGGLSIYDGTRFINYNQQDGLANELVNDIVEITPDSFLAATNIQKLNTLVHGKVGVYQTIDHFYPIVNRFLKSKNGSWYAAADEGLFELKDKKFIRLPLNKNGKDLGNCLDKMIEWENYILIVPWNNGLKEKLILYNERTGTVDDIVMDRGILSMEIDAGNKIWTSTSKGIQLLNPSSLKKGKIIFTAAPFPYRSVKTRELFFDASDNAWFFSSNEIQKISSQFQKQVFSAEQGLKVGTLTCLFRDKEGIMWMGTFGLKGAKQSLTMDNASSKVRFTAKKDIVFFIKTSGDVIDLTSYIKLYRFVTGDEKREVTIASKEGLITDKNEEKGKLADFSVKMISKDNYRIQFANTLEAGEYGVVWMKNMDLKEFNVFAFGIDWKTSD